MLPVITSRNFGWRFCFGVLDIDLTNLISWFHEIISEECDLSDGEVGECMTNLRLTK